MPNTRLFVGNLPYSATEDEVREVFARSGGVESVRIITDFDTGRSKGYAFVEMTTAEAAEKAIQELHAYSMGGRSLVVNEARPRAQGAGAARSPRT